MKANLILALLCPILWATGCHRAGGKTPEATEVKAEGNTIVLPESTIHAGTISVEEAHSCNTSVTKLNGRLVWDEDVTARIFTPFAGRISKIGTEVGREVAEGECLAQIASPDYGQAQADYRKAVSAYNLAERNLTRTRDLFEHGAAAQKDLFSTEADYDQAKSELERATAKLALYGGNTNSVDQTYEIKSPLAGVVVEKNVNPGQELRADSMLAQDPRLFAPLFVVTDPKHLWIQLEATEAEVAKLTRGQDILVRVRTLPGLSFPGKIDIIGDSLDPTTKIVRVRGSVGNEKRLLKAEMFVEAEVPLDSTASGVDVPKEAVFGKKGDIGFVFLEESPGRFGRREVKVGPEHGDKVLLLDGVQPGQRVVTEGCLLLNKILQDSAGS
jgi:cobalt-zinc-cadmium efflux system membrane fusion protein